MDLAALQAISLPLAVTFALALGFGATGLVQLVGPGFVRRAYRRWELPARLNRLIGVLMLLAAFFLATPNTRLWGVVLAGLINFLAVVMLLKNREYGLALPGLAVLGALPSALFVATVGSAI